MDKVPLIFLFSFLKAMILTIHINIPKRRLVIAMNISEISSFILLNVTIINAGSVILNIILETPSASSSLMILSSLKIYPNAIISINKIN